MPRFPSAVLAALGVIVSLTPVHAQGDPPLLLQDPTVSSDQIAFAFAGDLWIVARTGGEAKRLTSGVGIESHPRFSPNGKWIAFTGQYDGNTDIFVIPATGGIPRRLTYHPSDDTVVGWTPDSQRIIFSSHRDLATSVARLHTIALDGGPTQALPLPTGVDASFSPDGSQVAYVPTEKWQRAWKRYRGGQTTPIWLARLSDQKIEKLPRNNHNDSQPLWIGDKIYFLSDRNGPITLFRYDTNTRKVTEVIPNEGLDIKAASAGPGAIVYEQFGSIHLYDLATGTTQKLAIRLTGDLPEVRPLYRKVGGRLAHAGLSPTGARAVFEARGEILTVPAKKGDIRNLTRTTGTMEREPSWSPDGKWIAYFSDADGEYALHLSPQSGQGETKVISLGKPATFFYNPVWSPDSKKLAFIDKRLTLWYVDIEKGTPVRVDQTPYYNPTFQMVPAWSPDSRWITYARQLPSHLCAVFVYSLETQKTTQLTDGLSDSRYPAFDRSGKYLYFTASTDAGLTPGWLNMTSMGHAVTRSVYLAVLKQDDPSPLAPESDEEKDEKKDEKPTSPDAKPETPKVTIAFEGISQRILALPVPPRNYVDLIAGKDGTLFLLESGTVATPFDNGSRTVHRFDLASRKVERLTGGIGHFSLSANGEKALLRQGGAWTIAPAATLTGGDVLKTEEMEVFCDPRAEWQQMFHEAWRLERDFFYDPNLHGVDPKAMEQKYAPYLAGIASRSDLNYLFEEMLGELTCGHVFVGGGDQPEVPSVPVGLLGADYAVENGRFRITRIYNGENWNPNLRAPLTQPGITVRVGDYLLAVNGREVLPTQEVHAYFEATAGKQTRLKIGSKPDGSDAREVTVVPVADDGGLRNLAWIEDNRRKVEQLSGGRVGYVYLPDTADGGFSNFNRYFFAQVGKEGVIIDERYNGGGLIADYVIDYLRRPLQGYFAAREGVDYITPVGSIYGPKVMLINEYAGSGGDMMPWLFRDAKIGPLIGTRTWGGLVGMAGAAPLMDGGSTGAPQSGFWNPKGTWDVENHGVDPDIEVENDPASVQAGKDLQLEKAVTTVLEALKKHPLPKHKKPAYPNYQKGTKR